MRTESNGVTVNTSTPLAAEPDAARRAIRETAAAPTSTPEAIDVEETAR